MSKPHMTEEEIYMFLLNKAIYYRNTESLICSLQNYDPMLDVTYFIGEGYLRFSSPEYIKKIKNELILSKAFHNYVVDIYRKEFSTWKVKKVEKVSLIFSDQEIKFMDDVGFETNERYLYAYITGKSTCFRLGLKFLRGKDGRICKFKLAKGLKNLIKKIYYSTNMNMVEYAENEMKFISYVVRGDKRNIDFIKKNGKISKSLLTAYYKQVSKKIFDDISNGQIKYNGR